MRSTQRGAASAAGGYPEAAGAVAAARGLAACGHPTPEQIETLGGGWVAEEALAIAVFRTSSHQASKTE